MASATTTQPSKHASREEEEIRALVADWSTALEAKDAVGLAANCAPDVLLYDVKPPYQIKGADAYRSMWEKCLPYFPEKFKTERRDLRIAVDGDVAFMHCLHHIKPEKAHPAAETWMRVTVCYRKIDGKWKSVHEHVSVPFDPRSGKVSFITNPE